MATRQMFQSACCSTEIDQRRASAPVVTAISSGQKFKPTRGDGYSDDHAHGCGCGCHTCACRVQPVKDESNRNAYTGEGGRDIPRPAVDVSVSRLRSSSLNSDGSGRSQPEIINNSFEAQDPLSERWAMGSPSQTKHTHLAAAAIRTVTAAFGLGEEDDNPWPDFISPGHSSMSEDSSSMLFENMECSSLAMELDGPISGDASILSNYESSFHRQSVTVSQVLTGTGTSFSSNNFLPLTPECRHERTRQMCSHCRHY